jgi:RNA polymerase sigma-70 factor (ECF subfamily)
MGLPEAKEDVDERELVEQAKKDPTRFSALYERHFGRVYAFVSVRVATREDAEDVTSYVFHRALENVGRFEWRGAPFGAWLLRIAANAIADRWQKSTRDQKKHAEVGGFGSGSGQAQTDMERQLQVAELVALLPEDQRRVVVGRFLKGSTLRELADELGRTEGAVKQLQFRAMQSLRAQLGDDH